jgi:L-threonylcarbamoyladenylate synthase
MILEPTLQNIKKCAKELLKGNIIAIPTDTVYGIAVDASNEEAIEKLFEVKGRSFMKPVTLFISEKSQLQNIVKTIPQKAKILLNKYWPGPLTIIFNIKRDLPKLLTGPNNTVGVRIPPVDICLKLMKEANTFLAVTSANVSGEKDAVNALEVFNIFKHRIAYVIDGGECKFKVPATVINLSDINNIKIIREGSVSHKVIENLIGKVSK